MRRMTAAVVGVVLTLSLVGPAIGATFNVKARGENWRPKHRYIGKGDRVRFRNPTNRVHDIKAMGGWNLTEILSPGESVTKKFNNLGTFRYRCVRHSAVVGGQCQGMCGLVHVAA